MSSQCRVTDELQVAEGPGFWCPAKELKLRQLGFDTRLFSFLFSYFSQIQILFYFKLCLYFESTPVVEEVTKQHTALLSHFPIP